ncbi:MAG: bifunctional (p)ppGpp synthetase/guanosine-3',5'-bis(diphosphate) 3'-pyrophosphohydrolase [Acidobacteria bacterium]|nr:bifunctional (p)ppGpp synthetase/guanosine-3',5'-bis(diphosphate) 3'-pyrophosphohydrolase [Acidobacteriota bacterium]
MIRFEDLEDKVQQYHPGADLELLRRAYIFSAREHRGQVRRSGEPYLSHPLEVANILAEMKLDVVSVAVGLLHDVLEDTLTTRQTLQDLFGEEAAHLVDGVTKISKIQFSSKEEKQAENFRKLLLAMVDDVRVILVKLADRLHNMRTLQYLPVEKQKLIAQETLDIYAPIAHRLGMAKVRGELEDLGFSYLDSGAYNNVLQQVREKKQYSDSFIAEVTVQIDEKLREHGIQAEIQDRTKRIYSIHNKMRRQRISIDQVYDFIALRIVTDSVKDCYSVLGIVNNLWNPVPGRIKDYIAMPRVNGYQSLHTTVIGKNGQPFEVQIRTHEMHKVAEEGIAAHWKYKEGKFKEDQHDQRLVWVRHLLEWQQEVKDPRQFLTNLKIDLYPEEVYIFTPRGEVITLPRDATPVDFAYAVHTEVGHRCTGAKVNGRLVPLKYKLKNGEICEILTGTEPRPSRDWLSLVKTSRARNRIRNWLNAKQKEQAVEVGKKLLEREARKFKVNLKKFLQPGERQQKVLAGFEYQKLEDIFSDIGYGKIQARLILAAIEPDVAKAEARELKESKLTSVVNKVLGRSDSKIKVKGHDDLLVYRAKCCKPIRGEDVVGYITVGKGIAVHAAHCPNLENLLHNPERRIDVEWTGDVDGELYPVRVSIEAEDRQGILADITAAVAKVNTNIINVKATSCHDRRGKISMTLEIKDLGHLDQILGYIKSVPGVFDVERLKR